MKGFAQRKTMCKTILLTLLAIACYRAGHFFGRADAIAELHRGELELELRW